MSRTTVITGSASGIGASTAALLRSRGEHVIGVDVKGADVVADLSTPEGRTAMLEAVTDRSGGRIDAVVACAGLAVPEPITVSVNYFGALATLEGLRPLLTDSTAPRAVAVSSMASFHPHDDVLVEACLAGQEAKALEAARALVQQDAGAMIYGSTKHALNRWLRRVAATEAWAAAGIPLNAVGPGVIVTAMTEELVGSEEGRATLEQAVPMPLHGYGRPEHVAALIVWLAGPDNVLTTGQIVFIDGGADVVLRGDLAW
jgi:NAD(P)-dependent dehydrogenase (short-subunit alcohol dehydrogenase family)